MTLKLILIFVRKWIDDLFVSIKPNIQKFTLPLEKVTFQEKRYKIWFFFNKIWIGHF